MIRAVFNKYKEKFIPFIWGLTIILIVIGVSTGGLGLYTASMASNSHGKATWWSHKLALRREEIIDMEGYDPRIKKQLKEDVVRAQEKYNSLNSIAMHYTVLSSWLFGATGITLSLAAILLAILSYHHKNPTKKHQNSLKK